MGHQPILDHLPSLNQHRSSYYWAISLYNTKKDFGMGRRSLSDFLNLSKIYQIICWRSNWLSLYWKKRLSLLRILGSYHPYSIIPFFQLHFHLRSGKTSGVTPIRDAWFRRASLDNLFVPPQIFYNLLAQCSSKEKNRKFLLLEGQGTPPTTHNFHPIYFLYEEPSTPVLIKIPWPW